MSDFSAHPAPEQPGRPHDDAPADAPAADTSTERPDSPAHRAAVPEHVLVLGGGLAGVSTVAALRRRGYTGRITLVAEETEHYDRPPLSKELFTRTTPVPLSDQGLGEVETMARVLRPARAMSLQADEDGVAVTVVGRGVGAAETLDPGTGDIHPGESEPASFGAAVVRADLAVLATGAGAVLPAALSEALVLRSDVDAANLRAALGHDSPEVSLQLSPAHLVVVGAGWVGSEVASSAADQGLKVTVLEAGPAALWAQWGADLGERTRAWFTGARVDLRTGVTAQGMHRTDEGWRIELSEQNEHPPAAHAPQDLLADAVLLAVGAHPTTDLAGPDAARDAGGALLVTPDGSLLDGPATLRAVGDAATVVLPGGEHLPGGHWDGALHHPDALAAGILGQDLPQLPASSTFSTMFGHDLHAFGDPRDSPDTTLVIREDETGWTALRLREGRLVGAVLVDHPRDVSPLRKALAGGAQPPVDAALLADVDVPMKKALRGR